jgi:hypothetical protein
MIDWQTNWKAHGWSLSGDRPTSIMAYCADKCAGLTNAEMDAAIEGVCAGLETGKAQAPTMRVIVRAIYEARDRKRGIDTEKPFTVRQAESEIHRTPEQGLGRWEVICRIAGDPKTQNAGSWAKHLVAYARRLGVLTVPYWARKAGCAVVERADYVAGLSGDMRALYERFSGNLADMPQALAFEGRVERAGANRRDPGEEG